MKHEETRPPFGVTVEKVKSVTETPTYKMIGWIFPKVGWLIVVWTLWSMRTYAESYIRNSPVVAEHTAAIAQGEARLKMAEVRADVQSAQSAVIATNQHELAESIKDINKTNQQIQLNLAVMSERIKMKTNN